MRHNISQDIFLSSLTILVVMICSMTFAMGSAIITEVFRDTDGMESSQSNDVDVISQPTPDASRLSCDGINYRESADGVRYVREAGGGVYIGADINNKFTVYSLEQGYVTEIRDRALDEETTRKLEYALHNCRGPFITSGMVLTGKRL